MGYKIEMFSAFHFLAVRDLRLHVGVLVAGIARLCPRVAVVSFEERKTKRRPRRPAVAVGTKL